MAAARGSKLVLEDIGRLVASLDQEAVQESDSAMLRRGLSFTLAGGKPPDIEAVGQFLEKLVAHAEHTGVAALIKHLYEIKNPGNRRIDDDQRRFERLILAALAKHVGVMPQLLHISNRKALGDSGVLYSPFVKKVMEHVYSVRRDLMVSNHATIELREQAQMSMVPPEPQSLQQDYDAYCVAVKQKCVFLLFLEPVLSFARSDFRSRFDSVLKQLKDFIVAPVTFGELFRTLKAADDARSRLSAGLGLINDLFAVGNKLCSTYLLNRFASSSSTLTTLMSGLDSNARIALTQIKALLQNVQATIRVTDGNISRHVLLVLSSVFILQLAKIDAAAAQDFFVMLVTEIIGMRCEIGENFPAFAAFLVTLLVSLFEENPPCEKESLLARIRDVKDQLLTTQVAPVRI
jgi:hypothetical protein